MLYFVTKEHGEKLENIRLEWFEAGGGFEQYLKLHKIFRVEKNVSEAGSSCSESTFTPFLAATLVF